MWFATRLVVLVAKKGTAAFPIWLSSSVPSTFKTFAQESSVEEIRTVRNQNCLIHFKKDICSDLTAKTYDLPATLRDGSKES